VRRIGGHFWTHWFAAGLLATLTVALFAPTVDFEFVQYDDPIYVLDNPNLHAGLSVESIVRSFAKPYETNWIPLTWVSLQIDHALFGFDPAGYHLVNVGLHALSAVLLYLALVSMSQAPGPSLFVAAVFAVHPLHVESVAWVSERKDVLSGVFFTLTLLAYSAYARGPGTLASARGAARYAAVLVCFAAGLLAKPMLVTLPLILLLLDYWPLGRLAKATRPNGPNRSSPLGLLLEKLPLFAMSAAVATITIRVQRDAGAVATDRQIEPIIRLANAVETYWIYIGDSFWPRGLSVFYPHPGDAISFAWAAVAAFGLLAVSLLALRSARSRPYWIVGWGWFLVTLLPVIGIVQAGMQARADRYTYLAQTGLALAVAWTARDVFERKVAWRFAPAVLGAVVVFGFSMATRNQLPHWRDTRSLYENAIATTDANFVAHNGLAAELMAEGDPVAAERHYARAIEVKKRWPEAHRGHGDALLAQGRRDEAIVSYRRAVELAPARPLGHVHLAEALLEDNRVDAAIAHFQKALALYRDEPVPRIRARYAAALARKNEWAKAAAQYGYAIRTEPDFAAARSNLAFLQIRMGEYSAARDQFERVLVLEGESPEVHAGIASASRHLGDAATAVRHYEAALRMRPDWAPAANNLAWILATAPDPALRSPARAAALIEGLRKSGSGDSPTSLDTLAAAQAALGRFEEAATTAEAAAALARERRNNALAAEIEGRRAGYARREPFIDSNPTGFLASPQDSSRGNPASPPSH